MTVADEEFEKEAVRLLSRTTQLAVDSFVMDRQVFQNLDLTHAQVCRLIVEATVAYLIGTHLVMPVMKAPGTLPMQLPEHLVPEMPDILHRPLRP